MLHSLGLEEALRANAFLPEATQFRDWRSGKVIAESPLGAAAVDRYGMPYYHIHRGDLLRVLVDAAARMPGISLHAGARVEQISQNGDRATVVAGGVERHGDLLAGADGIHSTTRSALWGPDQPRFTGNVAWRALVPSARLPTGLVRAHGNGLVGTGQAFRALLRAQRQPRKLRLRSGKSRLGNRVLDRTRRP